jgi:hypothetical protein
MSRSIDCQRARVRGMLLAAQTHWIALLTCEATRNIRDLRGRAYAAPGECVSVVAQLVVDDATFANSRLRDCRHDCFGLCFRRLYGIDQRR